MHVADGTSADVWIELEDGSYHSNLRGGPTHEPPREIDGELRAPARFTVPADLPTRLPPAAGVDVRPTARDPAHREPGLVGHARPRGRPQVLGAGDPALQRALARVVGRRRPHRPHRPRRSGRPPSTVPASCWSTRCTPRSRRPRSSRRPTCRPRAASPTRSTCASTGSRRATRVDRDTRNDRRPHRQPHRAHRPRHRLDGQARRARSGARRGTLAPVASSPIAAFRRREGQALRDFATWCALAEAHGPDWTDWPAELQHPRTPAVAAFADAHADAIDFHCWLQWQLDEQLAATQSAARRAGMTLGIVHDLAVGVSATGADSWTWQDELARGITVGAPPDAYAQTGQDWDQPPLRPDRLAELGYAPLRELIANTLRHAGGLRVDHVIGLFRLWWIPAGAGATEGTYVRYDHDASIGILALEAARAGAVLVGEDLGTVEPWVRDYLRERGILGTSVLWFEFDYDGGGGPLAPERWREYCLASVTTHDLPPTAGYLAGDHVELRNDLGLLVRTVEEELDADRPSRARG